MLAEPGYANVGVYAGGAGVGGAGVGVGVGPGVGGGGVAAGGAARWRPLYVQRALRLDEAVAEAGACGGACGGAAAGSGAGAGWRWVTAAECRRHARASQTLEFNERAARLPRLPRLPHGTMPRAGGAGVSGGAGVAAAAVSGVSPLRVQVQGARLSSSCGTIDLPLELPPCVLLLQRCAPPAAPPPAALAPRPSCSYHLLPESHRGAPLHYPQEEAETTDACSTSSTAPSPSPRSDESLGSPEDDTAPDTVSHLEHDSADDD